jgi:hypothetical protein
MHPSQRLSYALVASLALWWPTLQGALRGDVDPLAASVRWVLAFVVASAGVRLVGGLVDRYTGDDDVERDTDTSEDDEPAVA